MNYVCNKYAPIVSKVFENWPRHNKRINDVQDPIVPGYLCICRPCQGRFCDGVSVCSKPLFRTCRVQQVDLFRRIDLFGSLLFLAAPCRNLEENSYLLLAGCLSHRRIPDLSVFSQQRGRRFPL